MQPIRLPVAGMLVWVLVSVTGCAASQSTYFGLVQRIKALHAGFTHGVSKIEQRVAQVVDKGVVIEGGQDCHRRSGVLRAGGNMRCHHRWCPRHHARLNAGVPCTAECRQGQSLRSCVLEQQGSTCSVLVRRSGCALACHATLLMQDYSEVCPARAFHAIYHGSGQMAGCKIFKISACCERKQCTAATPYSRVLM